MEISNEEAERLLNHSRNYSIKTSPNSSIIYKPLHNGSRNGGKEIPPLIRELIAISAHNGTIKETATAFDVSMSTVAQAKKGNVGVERHDPNLKERIDEHLKEKDKTIKDVALDRLAHMFETVISPENLSAIKTVDKAVVVAKDLSTIAEKLTSRVAGNTTAVFIHLPRVKDEAEYETIDIQYKPDERKRE